MCVTHNKNIKHLKHKLLYSRTTQLCIKSVDVEPPGLVVQPWNYINSHQIELSTKWASFINICFFQGFFLLFSQYEKANEVNENIKFFVAQVGGTYWPLHSATNKEFLRIKTANHTQVSCCCWSYFLFTLCVSKCSESLTIVVDGDSGSCWWKRNKQTTQFIHWWWWRRLCWWDLTWKEKIWFCQGKGLRAKECAFWGDYLPHLLKKGGIYEIWNGISKSCFLE